MTEQWGPRPGGPQVPPPPLEPERSSPHGCLVFFVCALGVYLAFVSLGGLLEGNVPLAVGCFFFSVLCLCWYLAAVRGPALDREREREEQAGREAVRRQALLRWEESRPSVVVAHSDDPLGAARSLTAGRAFLGLDPASQEWALADREHAVLVLGPPRSGKTSSIIIPSVLSATGPVVSTSTKAEVLHGTASARSVIGRVWLFDPAGTERGPAGVLELHWSPIWQSRTWDGARAMADAMVGASSAGEGVQNSTF